MGKGENAGNQHFLLFPKCFLPFSNQISISQSHLSSANAFNLDRSKILSFGKEMMLVTPLNGGLINMQPNVTTGAHLVNTLTFVTNCKIQSVHSLSVTRRWSIVSKIPYTRKKLVVALGFNASLTAMVMSWRSMTYLCFLALSHQY